MAISVVFVMIVVMVGIPAVVMIVMIEVMMLGAIIRVTVVAFTFKIAENRGSVRNGVFCRTCAGGDHVDDFFQFSAVKSYSLARRTDIHFDVVLGNFTHALAANRAIH